ncbi:hypothetical protein CR918_11105 [Stenotrophomonas indicatrix]|nr:hypothetical protein CR918_11105 [Stenotrophomonas indicatrix]
MTISLKRQAFASRSRLPHSRMKIQCQLEWRRQKLNFQPKVQAEDRLERYIKRPATKCKTALKH